MPLAVALALAAALLFAVGTVLQQRVAVTATEAEAARAGFLLRLARRPQWLAGMLADVGGFVAQAAALAVGSLVVVQPVLSSSLVFTLPLGAALEGRRVGRRAMLGATSVTCGLAAFLVLADPGGGQEDASTAAWFISFGIAAVVCGTAWALARGAPPVRRALLLGSATGVLFALSAGLTKATVEQLDDGVLSVLADWHLYALVVVGYASTVLAQQSLQAGALGPAVATQLALDPVTSVLLGTLAFDETIHSRTAGTIGALAGIAVMIAGIVVLASQAPPSVPSAASRAEA